MRTKAQTTLSVVLEVQPASAGLLSTLIERLKAVEDVQLPGESERYLVLKESVPSLHFMSMSVFEDPPLRSDLRDRSKFRGRARAISGATRGDTGLSPPPHAALLQASCGQGRVAIRRGHAKLSLSSRALP